MLHVVLFKTADGLLLENVKVQVCRHRSHWFMDNMYSQMGEKNFSLYYV